MRQWAHRSSEPVQMLEARRKQPGTDRGLYCAREIPDAISIRTSPFHGAAVSPARRCADAVSRMGSETFNESVFHVVWGWSVIVCNPSRTSAIVSFRHCAILTS